MHVLHLIDGLGLGGAERMLVDIANQTAADGHRVSVCVTRTDLTLRHELSPAIEVLVLGRTNRISPVALARLAGYIRARRVDVVHVHLRSNLAFLAPLRAAHLVRAPIVFHDHYGTIEVDTEIPAWFRIARRYIEVYVGVYQRLVEWAVAAGVPPARAVTIPNALDLARLESSPSATFIADLKLERPKLVIIAVATLRPDKALEVLLDAVARSRHRDEFVVLSIGTEPNADYAEALRVRARTLGLDETMRFVGGRTDVPQVLRTADAAILTSKTESGPLVLIEYLAAKLPIVSTRVGDIGRRLASAGVPGFVEAGDVDAIVRELDALVELTPDERRARGELGRQKLAESFDLRVVMPRWYDAYRAAIASR